MPPLTSYKNLAAQTRYLNGIASLGAAQSDGVTQADLTACESRAKTAIDQWLLGVCGETQGLAVIVALESLSISNVDPAIADLADLLGSSYAWKMYETRNQANIPRGEAPPMSQSETLRKQAVDAANSIQASGKTITVAKTVRRLRYSKYEQGPAVGGPMANGSLFDDHGFTTDGLGRTRSLPHRHPLDEAGY